MRKVNFSMLPIMFVLLLSVAGCEMKADEENDKWFIAGMLLNAKNLGLPEDFSLKDRAAGRREGGVEASVEFVWKKDKRFRIYFRVLVASDRNFDFKKLFRSWTIVTTGEFVDGKKQSSPKSCVN